MFFTQNISFIKIYFTNPAYTAECFVMQNIISSKYIYFYTIFLQAQKIAYLY